MKLRKSERKQVKLKCALQGPSGSGKTFSSLLLAFGICKDWSKIALIDGEHSADLYAHLGHYNVLSLDAPFSSERYINAIRLCVNEGMHVIIIDSISQLWSGSGGILDQHAAMAGNSFTNWSKLTPKYNTFIQEIIQSPVHIICTMRTKTDYILSENNNGKSIIQKVGLKAIAKEDTEYEFDLVFDLDIKNNATASKDRTGLFFGKPEQKISTATGKQILDWCMEGTSISVDEVSARIGDCKSIQELLALYHEYPHLKSVLQKEFEQRKRQIILNREVKEPIDCFHKNFK